MSQQKTFSVLPVTPAIFQLYNEFLEARELPHVAPEMARFGLWIAVDDKLVLGCTLHQLHNGYILAENLASDPEANAHDVHFAVRLAVSRLIQFCTAVSARPLVIGDHLGIGAALERAGFAKTNAWIMDEPRFDLKQQPKPVPVPPKPKPAAEKSRAPAKKRRGRPLGSKNKPKQTTVESLD